MDVFIVGFYDAGCSFKGLSYCSKPIVSKLPDEDDIYLIGVDTESTPFYDVSGRKIIIYGAGKIGGSLLSFLKVAQVNVIAFADRDEKKTEIRISRLAGNGSRGD